MKKENVSFLLACCLVVCKLIVLYNIWVLGFSRTIFNYTLLLTVFSILYCITNIPKIKEQMGTQVIGFYILFEVSIVIFIILTGGVVFRYFELIMFELIAAILAVLTIVMPKYNKLK